MCDRVPRYLFEPEVNCGAANNGVADIFARSKRIPARFRDSFHVRLFGCNLQMYFKVDY